MPSQKLVLLLMTLPMASAGCASVEPGYAEAATRAEAALPDRPDQWQSAADSVRGEPIGWIEAFEDPALLALVKEAQEKNNDLAAAAAAVDRARALARLAGAELSPQLDLVAGAENSGVVDGDDSSAYSVGLELTWEADVWGRIRSGKQAETANFEATQADFRFAQYALAANVATSYLLAIEAVRQENITQGVVNALAETSRIVDVRFDNGLSSAQDRALARSELATAQDQLEDIKGAVRDAFRALEVLIGRYPSADLDLREDLPVLPSLPASGIPSELLERRPDIIAAERRIAASVDALDAAEAAKLPRFSLTTSFGGASEDLGDIFDPENLAWSVVSNLAAPLFDGGRLDSQVDIESADLEEAVAEYAQAALEAFSEVETALDQSSVLLRRQKVLQTAESEAAEAYRLARLSYQTGETDLIDVLTIQQTLFDAQSNRLSVERALRENHVSLSLALGGDWRTDDEGATAETTS
ncbi:MAG: TolC family protein [Pseudomonadota bacterium]